MVAPTSLRRIHYFGDEKNMRLIFLINNFQLAALTIADLYRARGQVELFFRSIKQHLHIRAFHGVFQ
jgi:IS4 transposase